MFKYNNGSDRFMPDRKQQYSFYSMHERKHHTCPVSSDNTVSIMFIIIMYDFKIFDLAKKIEENPHYYLVRNVINCIIHRRKRLSLTVNNVCAVKSSTCLFSDVDGFCIF